MSIYQYPPMPSPVLLPPVPSTLDQVLRRGVLIGLKAGMWAAAAVAAIPCLILLFFGGIGLPIAVVAIAIGAMVGILEGLIEALVLYLCRRWIGRHWGRAELIGVLAAAIAPAGLAIVDHTLVVLEWVGVFMLLAGPIAACVARYIRWNETERRGYR